MNHKNFANKLTHPRPKRGFVPQAVLTRPGKINTACASVNTTARPVNTAGSKSTMNHPRLKPKAYKRGHSHDIRPNNKFSAHKNNIFNKKVNTVRVNDNTARDRASGNLRREETSDILLILKLMMVDLFPLEMEKVEFLVKLMMVDLFPLEMKKVEFLVKLLDESQVLLRVPRKDNIYSVDLKSVVLTGGLTCLFAKFTLDESNLWHMRLGNINFKTMNKLVKGNLVREAVNTACYVLDRALVTKPHNKTPYELICGRPPLIDFMKPFGCSITILNTRDNLGKFEREADEGYFVGYLVKALEQEYILIPICTTDPLLSQGSKDSTVDAGKKAPEVDESEASDNVHLLLLLDHHLLMLLHKHQINAAGPSTSTNAFEEHSFERFSPFKNSFSLPHVPIVTPIDDTGIFGNAYDDEVLKEEVDMNNVDSSYTIPEATKFLKDHPQEQVIRSLETLVQTRQISKTHEEFRLLSSVHKLRRTNHKDFQNCLFACFLSQMEPKKPVQALQDPSWVEAMQDELLQFKMLKVWTLVDLPKDK
nr:ribonuclease H-like domain-containing protein [Tanacetum cinerariifolium]